MGQIHHLGITVALFIFFHIFLKGNARIFSHHSRRLRPSSLVYFYPIFGCCPNLHHFHHHFILLYFSHHSTFLFILPLKASVVFFHFRFRYWLERITIYWHPRFQFIEFFRFFFLTRHRLLISTHQIINISLFLPRSRYSFWTNLLSLNSFFPRNYLQILFA